MKNAPLDFSAAKMTSDIDFCFNNDAKPDFKETFDDKNSHLRRTCLAYCLEKVTQMSNQLGK